MTVGRPALLATEEVARASTAWIWYPPEAEVVETPHYLLVRFPDHFGEPLQVLRTDGAVGEAALGPLVDEVLERAREWRVAEASPHLTWWVKLDAPGGLDDLLIDRGEPDETLAVLARPYGGPLPDLRSPDEVTLRPVVDRQTARHSFQVEAAVFGGAVPADAVLDATAAQCRGERCRGEGERYVAYVEDLPVGSAGLAYVDGVVRLWGAGVLAAHRHRGVYRALLDARLRWGAQRGARLALVKGRVQTSAPVLRRAGFASYGEERSYRVPLLRR